MQINTSVKAIVEQFKQITEIDAISLAGSFANNTNDDLSDYDIYVYSSTEISLKKRIEIIQPFCSNFEFNNQFWETEDDVVLTEENIPLDIIYRNINWIESSVKSKLQNFNADVGYTTCFWANIKNSIILYDKNNRLTDLKKACEIDFPQQLKINIINKNYPLLKKQIPSYYWQIEKAIIRNDAISINHRVAAFLASYFDIIFAINEIPHPGEKKIILILNKFATKLPINMESDINNLLNSLHKMNKQILANLDILIEKLDLLL